MSVFGERILELPGGSEGDPMRGRTLRRRFVGTPDQIDSLMLQAIVSGHQYERPPPTPGEPHELLVSYGPEELHANPNEPLIDYWDLIGSDFDESIWLTPKVIAGFDKINSRPYENRPDPKIVATLRQVFEAFGRGESEWIDDNGDGHTLTLEFVVKMATDKGMELPFVVNLLGCLARGVDSHPLSRYILAHRIGLTKGSKWRWNPTNIGKVFISTAQLIEKEHVPEDAFPFDLPEGMWLKRTPTMRQTAAWRWEGEQEYWWFEKIEWFVHEPAT
jgi:hypothetical protein